jgi:carotenoid cleavage dioxygenase-like enzyme
VNSQNLSGGNIDGADIVNTRNEAAAEPVSYRTNLGPVDFEADARDLPVSGRLPPALEGLLVRNGPNPMFAGEDANEHWFLGDGMLHGFHFAGGRVRYLNRWVRTQRWLAENAAQRALAASFDPNDPNAPDFGDGVANTNIAWHAGRLLALEEGHLPIGIEPSSLATLGPVDFAGRVNGPFTAHPKVDPATGELLFFGYGTPADLSAGMSYGTLDARGNVTRFDRFDAPYASMVHDFMVTEAHVLFPVMPLAASLDRARRGLPPFAWEPERGTRVGVMRRDAGTQSIEWWSAPSCYVFHVMNAWEANGRIHADVMQFATPPKFTWPDGSPIEEQGPARLCRWTFDLSRAERVVEQEWLSDAPGEFPRIDERFAGRAYRHGWFAGHGEDAPFSRIVHIDHATREVESYELAVPDCTSEPVFVASSSDSPEGDGWILAVVYRGETRLSDLLVFDAAHVAKGPVASVAVPYRVPNGFHGNWVPAGALHSPLHSPLHSSLQNPLQSSSQLA